MKILLDECLNWRLKREFQEHDVRSVQDAGWLGIENGELLTLASQNGFEAFVTIDKQLRYQQNVKKYYLSIIVLKPRLNRIEYLLPLIPKILQQLPYMKKGEVYEIQ